jgi:transcriptional regulator with XRE-family HTH domain
MLCHLSPLRRLRTELGISQEALARLAGVPQRTISALETRGPTAAILSSIKLARALNVSSELLFGHCVPRRRTRRPHKAPDLLGVASQAEALAPSPPATDACSAAIPERCEELKPEACAGAPERPRT